MNDQRQSVTKGDIFFIGKNNFHTYEQETGDFSWINCLFLPSAVDKAIFNSANADEILRASFGGNIIESKALNLSRVLT